MKRIALILVIFLLTVGLTYAKDFEIVKQNGDYTVKITMDRNPPVTGKNKLEVGIKDIQGKIVTDAVVVVAYAMPAMPGMPAMNYKSKAEVKGNRYLSTVDFSMPGPWAVTIKITRGGKTQAVKLNVDVT